MADPRDASDARQRLYCLLAEPFRFPDMERVQTFARGKWDNEVSEYLRVLDLSLGAEPPSLETSFNDYQVDFISLFEVGLGGAPCPLHSGYHARDRMRELEEVVRFYRFFEYEPARTQDRFHDHLVFELEFMAHLIGREAGALYSARLAQKDFVQRHLAKWVARLRDDVEKRAGVPFIRGAVRVLHEFINEDVSWLESRTESVQVTAGE